MDNPGAAESRGKRRKSFALPYINSGVENLFAQDGELVGFLRFRPNMSLSQGSNAIGESAGPLILHPVGKARGASST
jgi:hypothetical protein